MAAKTIAQAQPRVAGDEIMSWRAAATLWIGLAALGWMSIGAAIKALF